MLDEFSAMANSEIVMINHARANSVHMNEGDMYVSPNSIAIYLEKTNQDSKVLLLRENFAILSIIVNWSSVISVAEGYVFAQVLASREKIILHCGINSWATKETDAKKVAERLWKNAVWNRNTKVRVEFT